MPKIRTRNVVKGTKSSGKSKIAYGLCPACGRSELAPKRSPSGKLYGECPTCRRTFTSTPLS